MIRTIETIECPECGAHFETPSKAPISFTSTEIPEFGDKLIKMAAVETCLAKFFHPVPSRPTLITWLKEGILRGHQIGRGENWFVYKSSVDELAEKLAADEKIRPHKMAA